MKWLIKTIKMNDLFMTFNEYWDNPDIEEGGYEFPNQRVGVGKNKQESIDNFNKYYNEVYQPLLASVKENVRLAHEMCFKKK